MLTSFTSEKRVRDEEERKPKMLHFFFVAWVTFLGEMSRGVVVPILWEYVQEVNILFFISFSYNPYYVLKFVYFYNYFICIVEWIYRIFWNCFIWI